MNKKAILNACVGTALVLAVVAAGLGAIWYVGYLTFNG